MTRAELDLTFAEQLHHQLRNVVTASVDLRRLTGSDRNLIDLIQDIRVVRNRIWRLPVRSEVSKASFEADWARHRLAVRQGIDRRLSTNHGYDTISPYDDLETILRWDRGIGL